MGSLPPFRRSQRGDVGQGGRQMPEEVGAMGCAANRKSLPAWCVAERTCSAALYIRAPSIRLCAFRFSCECGCECHAVDAVTAGTASLLHGSLHGRYTRRTAVQGL